MGSLASPVRTHAPRACEACGSIIETPSNAAQRFCRDEVCRAARRAAKHAEARLEAARLRESEDAPPKPPSQHVLLKRAFRDAALATVTDQPRPICSADVRHRFAEWIAAREAVADEERGAQEAHRQSLVELAAAALRVAADSTPFEDEATPPQSGQLQSIAKLVPPDLLVAA